MKKMRADIVLVDSANAANRQRDHVEVAVPDLLPLAACLHNRRRGVGEEFRSFLSFWDGECLDFFKLSACIVRLDKEAMENECLAVLPSEALGDRLKREIASGCIVIWTLGEEIDQQSQRLAEKNMIHGLFLDVVATLMLMGFHEKILEYVKNSRLLQGKTLMEEYYPDASDGSRIAALITPIAMDAGFFVRYTNWGMFLPRKTQYSLLFFGDNNRASEGRLVFKKPCELCSGGQCLYYQLNACHVGAGWMGK